MTEAAGVDPVDALLVAIRALGDGPEPAPNDRLVALLAERHAKRSAFEAVPPRPDPGPDWLDA